MTEPKVIRPHPGGYLDHLRTAVLALQLAAELSHDEQELARIHEVITALQQRLAAEGNARERELAAEGPALRRVDRAAG
jgi:hypothetical protein